LKNCSLAKHGTNQTSKSLQLFYTSRSNRIERNRPADGHSEKEEVALRLSIKPAEEVTAEPQLNNDGRKLHCIWVTTL
jgi:hypothetical protein